VKKIMVPCDCGGVKQTFAIYIGKPIPGHHPIGQQAAWIYQEKGCTVPQEVMDALRKLFDIAQENGVSFEELVMYAMPEEIENVETPEPPEIPETPEHAT
jgi:hypothetical protein